MESLQDIWVWLVEHVLVHWPFISGITFFYITGVFMKAQVWTKERAFTPGKMRNFFHFMRRTMAMHPVITGALIGCIPAVPVSPGIEGFASDVLYWSSSGLCSSFAFHAFASFVKKKTDGKLDLEKTIEDAVNPSMVPSTPPEGTPKAPPPKAEK